MKVGYRKNLTLSIQFIIVFIILITIFMFIYLNNKLVPKLNDYINFVMEKIINQEILNVFDNEIYINRSLLDILIITMNSDDEIISVDYDLELSNEVLKGANTLLINKLNNLDIGINNNLFVKPSYFEVKNSNLIMNVPITFSSNNTFIKYLGPFIPVRIEVLSDYYSNLETSIKQYGINTILVELYVMTTIKNKIIFNSNEEVSVFEYDQLIASKIINGSIPEYYGGSIISSSPLVGNLK